MPRPLALLACLLPWFLAGSPVSGQGTRADYDRALRLEERTRDTVLNARVQPAWIGNGDHLWYRRDLPGGGREFLLVNASTGEASPLFSLTNLAALISAEGGKPVDAARFVPADLEVSGDLKQVLFTQEGVRWRFGRDSNRVERATPAAVDGEGKGTRRRPREQPRPVSPDGRWTVRVRDHNLRLKAAHGEEEKVLSREGNGDDGYSADVVWSPDSTRLVAWRHVKPQEHKVYYVESSPGDQLQPKLDSIDYLKPGDRIPQRKPHLFDVEKGTEIPVNDLLFANPWEIDDVHWEPDSSRFFFVYNQRGHQVMRVLSVDARTGVATTVVDERCATFFDYAFKQFHEWIDARHELVWMSERDGWNHLYLYDTTTGRVKNPITHGEWVVRGVDRVDSESRRVWFRAGGVRPGQDPYFVQVCRVNLDGTGLTVLTEGDGTHAVDWSPDHKRFIDRWSRVDHPPTVELRDGESGRLIRVLEQADDTAWRAAGFRPPESFVAKGRDGTTDIYGVIHRPTRFDAGRKYPVIEHIYAGPQDSYVPKEWHRSYGGQEMAELGFIVVQIDGMGTSNRSKKFHDVCWHNLADAGFPDRIAWIKAAATSRPWMDVSRVGIYGGSAGGQNAMRALIDHPDFYRVAAADCGCHDNRMDKIWWNELWMGWPVGPQYEECSNAVHAHRLQGKLMLIVGEMDKNVDPASTLQVVNALVKADKDFDLVVIPGGGHGSGDSPYGKRRQMDFFVRHLLGVEPRAQ
jgi:dipeptidyl aminopeptidase/acylaminoacyl peptidase